MISPNPLHAPRPPDDKSLFDGKFVFLGGAPSLPIDLRLTASYLWLSVELNIPLDSIVEVQVVETHGWLKISSLQILFNNPITNESEYVLFSSQQRTWVGFPKREPLEELKALLDPVIAARREVIASDPEVQDVPPAQLQELVCEHCGSKPAFYTGYILLFSPVAFSYRSAEKRRVHCSSCILKNGLPDYLITMLLGWPGPGIIDYPAMLRKTAFNLKPVFGDMCYVLAFAPLPVVAGLIIWFCYLIF